VHQLAGLAYKQAVGLLGANVLGNFNLQLEWIYVIVVNIFIFYNGLMLMCVCIDIETTLLILSTFLWTS
jgi:hypothetical protein